MTPEERAAGDRDFLAKLRRLGKVFRRDGADVVRHPEVARPFIRDIEQRSKSIVNLAIRPKKRKKR